jgi:hypothetical protein
MTDALHEARENIIDADYVMVRLEEAGATLLALPNAVSSTKPRLKALDVVRSALESYGWSEASIRSPLPSTERIARMDEALGWISLIPVDRYVLRRVVGARSLVDPVTDRHLYPWRRLGKAMGADHKAIQRWHGQGIALIVAGLRGALTLAEEPEPLIATMTPSTPPWLTPAVQERATAEVQRVLAAEGRGDERAVLQHIVECYDMAADLFTSDADCAETLAAHARKALDRVTIADLATQIVLAVLAACVPEVEALRMSFGTHLLELVDTKTPLGKVEVKDIRAALLAAMRGE